MRWIAASLVVVFAIALADEQVRVLQPATLRAQFPNSGLINCRPALFGTPQYQSTVTAQVVWATPGDRDGCAPIDKSLTNWPPSGSPVIVMVDRGTCSFVQKVRNCEYAGASAAIVVDNINEYYLPYMADDGSGRSITVPSVLIHKNDGLKIKNALLANETVFLSMTWSLPEPDNRVEVAFWTSPENDEGNLKHTFGPAVAALDYHAKFTYRYIIYDGVLSGCTRPGHPCRSQCSNGDRYCVIDPERDFTKGYNGSDCVREAFRQICLSRYLNRTGQDAKWWPYASRVIDECSPALSQACSFNVMQQLGIPLAPIQKCMSDAEPSGPSGPNSLLELEMDARYEFGVFYLPTIYVNDVPYRGNVACANPSDITRCGILNMICQGYQDGTEPSACFSDPGCAVGLQKDACGVCGGTGSFDVCGRCWQRGDDRVNKSCADCKGVPNGRATWDDCGVCGGTGSFDACGYCYQKNDRRRIEVGQGGPDACGNCLLYSSPSFNKSCAGCDNVPNSGKVLDVCGICDGKSKVEDCKVTTGGGFPVGGVVGIVGGSVVAVGGAIFCYMRRRENKMKSDIDSLLRQYLPLDAGAGISAGGGAGGAARGPAGPSDRHALVVDSALDSAAE